VGGSRGDESIGVGQSGGDWLFDQDVEAGFHEGAANLSVQRGGDGNYGGVGETGELRKIGYGRAAEFGGNGQGAGGIGVDGSSEAGAFGVAHDAEMVAAEDATTDDGDAGEGHNYSSGG